MTVMAVLAALLPPLIFAAVIVAFNSYSARQAVEAAALQRAHQIMSDVDSDIARSIGGLQVLATTRGIRERDLSAARAVSVEVTAMNPDWQSVTLLDLQSGKTLFSTGGGETPLRPADFSGEWRPGRVTFGGIARRPGRCTCALMGVALEGAEGRLALIAEIDPANIQRITMAATPPGAVSAVVDRRGNFISRSVDYANRVGTPATIYVRSSLKLGDEGFYEGKTYEGLVNLTALVKSPQSGWSTHMAVSSNLIAGPQQRFYMAVGLATLLALLFAAATTWAMLRNLKLRRNAEARLFDAQHLEALGRLTGGVAHDFNNMLAIISGNIEIASRSPDLPPKVRRNLSAAAQGAERAAELTRRMLSYARRQKLTPAVLDPTSIIKGIGELLERTVGDHIRLRCEAEAGTWCVNVDRSELENAIVNLTVNARDAMPDGGEIVILAQNAPAGSEIAGKPVPEDSVAFSVHDTGHGIPAELLARITDPFFTTKAPGHGTGLGLSQVHGLVNQSGGELRIQSEVGVGTHIYLILPRHAADAPEIAEAPAREQPDALPPLKVIVVEDDPNVRKTTVGSLEALGLSPREFESAEAALAAFDEDAWDLLITDNQMAGISGVALVSRIRERGDDLPAVILSALPVEGAPRGTVTLGKPFSIEGLRAAIDNALRGRPSPPSEVPD